MTDEQSVNEDARVQAMLRQVAPLPSYTAEEWDRLGRRILAAAEPAWQGRNLRPVWRDDLQRLSRLALPVALAAGGAALILLNRVEANANRDAAPSTAFLSAMAGETTRETVVDLTLGQNSQGLLLADGR